MDWVGKKIHDLNVSPGSRKVAFYKVSNNISTFVTEMLRVNCISVKCMWLFSPLISVMLFWCGLKVQNMIQSGFHTLHFRGTEVWDLAVQQIADTSFSFNHSWWYSSFCPVICPIQFVGPDCSFMLTLSMALLTPRVICVPPKFEYTGHCVISYEAVWTE